MDRDVILAGELVLILQGLIFKDSKDEQQLLFSKCQIDKETERHFEYQDLAFNSLSDVGHRDT